jgi:hypothetical protein
MRASRTRIWGVTLALAAAGAAVYAPAASAGTAQLKDAVLRPTGQGVQVLVYRAGAGERNSVNASYGSGVFILSDRSGATPGTGCVADTPNRVRCSVAGGKPAGGIALVLGDGNDFAIATGTDAEIAGGSGNDSLFGSGHDDTLIGGSGNDLLEGGVGEDAMLGGSGNDRIQSRDSFTDAISCGKGRDRLIADGLDYFGDRCERVSRSDRAGATVIDLLSSRAGGGTATVLVGCPRDAPRTCRGSVRIREGSRTLGTARFSVKRKRIGRARIRLPDDVVRRLETTSFGVRVVLKANRGRLHRTVTVPQVLPGL